LLEEFFVSSKNRLIPKKIIKKTDFPFFKKKKIHAIFNREFGGPGFGGKLIFEFSIFYIFPRLKNNFYGFPMLPPGTRTLKIHFLTPKTP